MSLASRFVAAAPERIKRVFLAVDWFPARRLLRSTAPDRWRRDLWAAFNGALVAFPQGVACAMIAGLPISFGLFGSAVASLVGPWFSGTRFIVLGPTNSTAVLLLSSLLASGLGEAGRAGLVALLLLLVGVLQIAAAHLNIGSLVAYISRSVIVGYVSAAVVLIIVNQVGNLTGVEVADAATLFGILRETLVAVPGSHAPTIVVSLATAAVFLAFRRYLPKLPHIALTLVVSAGFGAAAKALGYPVAMLPAISATSWSFSLPVIDFAGINQLASAALAIAFLGVLESSSVGKLLAARAGERLNTNQETLALGLSNVACAFTGGMPASGSPTRSMINFTSGAATPAAAMLCSVLLLVLIFVFGGFMDLIPRASLAVVVVLVASALFNVRQIRFVTRSTPADAAVFAVTAGAALVFPLDTAIFLGTGTSIVFFLRQAGEPDLVEYAFTSEGHLTEIAGSERRPLPEISIVHVEGSLFFGASELLQEQIRRVCDDPNLRILILRLKHAHHLDASTILALEELVQFMRENDRGLIVSGARKEVYRICKRTGLLEMIGRENFFVEWPQNPTLSTRNALKRAQQILGQKEAAVRVFGEMRTKRAET